jgi:ferric-dicitrate binding protein FerR (iron transport regulator)
VTEPTDKQLLDATARLRHESERALDELTIARLRAARLNAAAHSPGRRRFWTLAGGVAAAGMALALAGVIWLRVPSELPNAQPTEPPLADLELLATDSPDFYGNLDFYEWLASQSGAS